jgi:hypothetical protein
MAISNAGHHQAQDVQTKHRQGSAARSGALLMLLLCRTDLRHNAVAGHARYFAQID